MSRYFLEVAYKGTNYSGFQSQQNANTIQAEVEKALGILLRLPSTPGEEGHEVRLTGSSRTDAGVHAVQNFFHFDTNNALSRYVTGWKEERFARRSFREGGDLAEFIYNLNALLPEDIVVKRLFPVADHAHCRFNALNRTYKYFIYRYKNPFLKDQAFYFPYKLDVDLLKQAAALIMANRDFTSFSKRNTQAKTFECEILESEWYRENDCLVYHVKANRFLRGMVRALTATMLRIGRGKMTLAEFQDIIRAKDCTKASFAVPSGGLFLISVEYPPGLQTE